MAASPIPSGRRARQPRAHRDPPPRAPGSSARAAKRNHSRVCSTAQKATNPPSWGPKRARTAPSGRAAARSAGCSSRTRDWANLGGEGPAGVIAELALASDVADYVRFRAVCRSWRRCSPDPRDAGLDGRFLPRRWTKIEKALAGPRDHRFLNVSTGECIRMDLPELAEHTLLALTPEGLLLLLHEATMVVRLLNPLTHQLTDLPPVTAILQGMGYESAERVAVYGVGLVADASAVAVCFYCPMVLAVAKPGEESWTVVDKEHKNSALPFAGRFFCANYRGVMVLDISSDQQRPRLLTVADRSSLLIFSSMMHSLHLVGNGGELLLVHRTLCADSNYYRKYEVYRVDLDAGILVPVKGFNGRAVFMGMSRTISVAAEAFPLSLLITSIWGPNVMGKLWGIILEMEAGKNFASTTRCTRVASWTASGIASRALVGNLPELTNRWHRKPGAGIMYAEHM